MTFPTFSQSKIAIALATMVALAGCNKAPETEAKPAEKPAAATEANTDSANGTPIKVGSDLTYPPYEFLENDKPAGFDIELMNAMAKNAGSTADYVDTRFENLIPGLDGKKYDAIISALYVNEDRLKKYNMIPYFTSNQVVVVKTDAEYQPKAHADLCGKTIATMKGAILAEQLQKITDTTCKDKSLDAINIREFPTSPDAIQAVLSGAADALYDDAALGKAAVDKLGGKIKISSDVPFFPSIGGIVVRKDDQATYDKLKANLDAIRANGEYDQLLAKYGLKSATEADIADLKAKAAQ